MPASWFNNNWKQNLKERINKAFPQKTMTKQVLPKNEYWTVDRLLDLDDRDPILVRIEGNDHSKNHAIAIADNLVFDAASFWILTKTAETLNWCAGDGGFKRGANVWKIVDNNC